MEVSSVKYYLLNYFSTCFPFFTTSLKSPNREVITTSQVAYNVFSCLITGKLVVVRPRP